MAKKWAIISGIVFVVVGILGFVPNPIIGLNSFFVSDLPGNLFTIIVGLILLAVGLLKPDASATSLKVVGIISLILTILGFIFVPTGGVLFGLTTLNSADNFLDLVLGVILVVIGYAVSPENLEVSPIS